MLKNHLNIIDYTKEIKTKYEKINLARKINKVSIKVLIFFIIIEPPLFFD